MIPARHPYLAVYGWRDPTFLPVEAWDDDGSPIVLDEEHGHLVRADTLSHYAGVRQAGSITKIGVLPPGGWRVVTLKHGQVDAEYPLIGWVVGLNGWATPLIVTNLDEARAEPVSVDNDDLRLIPSRHPRHRQTAPAGPRRPRPASCFRWTGL